MQNKTVNKETHERRYRKALAFLKPFIKLFWHPTVIGAENIPDSGCLVVSNHLSFADIPILAYALDTRALCFMAKKELFKVPLLGAFAKSLGAFPVSRGTADVSALKTAETLAKEGRCVVIFPQGTRKPDVDPKETEVHGGAALIAQRADVPCLPCYIKAKNRRVRFFSKNTVYIGKPVFPSELEGGKTEATKKLFMRICDLGETGEWK